MQLSQSVPQFISATWGVDEILLEFKETKSCYKVSSYYFTSTYFWDFLTLRYFRFRSPCGLTGTQARRELFFGNSDGTIFFFIIIVSFLSPPPSEKGLLIFNATL